MTAQSADLAQQPALLAVAHGSRDPRHAAALHGLLAAVRRARPGLRAELGFLDLCGPDVPAALARLVESGGTEPGTAESATAESGGENPGAIGRVIVVPLFLSYGHHVGHDVPAVTAQARRAVPRPPRLTIADPLGPDPLLDEAMDSRLREQGVYGRGGDRRLVVASATGAPGATAKAIRELRARGGSRIAVASFFLAPGLLYDRVRDDALAARVPIAAPLTTPDTEPPAALVRLVLTRYAQAARGRPPIVLGPATARAA